MNLFLKILLASAPAVSAGAGEIQLPNVSCDLPAAKLDCGSSEGVADWARQADAFRKK